MDHSRFIKSLVLFNAAVLVAAVNFLARKAHYSFSYNGTVDHVIQKLSQTVDWERVVGIMFVSFLFSTAVYYFVTALVKRKEPWA
jgi:hypothetical protein